MKDSVKANLIVFLIIAIVSLSISSSFANLTIKEETDSYKLIPIENDSFEPNNIEEVPTIIEIKNTTNTTNTTNNTYSYDNYTNHTNSYLDYSNNYFVETYVEQ